MTQNRSLTWMSWYRHHGKKKTRPRRPQTNGKVGAGPEVRNTGEKPPRSRSRGTALCVIRSYGSEFGLTPYTRMQLGLPVQEVEDMEAGFEAWYEARQRKREEQGKGNEG